MPLLWFWTRAMKSLYTRNQEVWKQKEKSTDSKELAREQDFWGTWNGVHIDLLCQNCPLGLQHSLVILCQAELSSSQSALTTRPVRALMFETDRILSLIHLGYFTDRILSLIHTVLKLMRGKNNGNQGHYVSTTGLLHCLTKKHQVNTCKIQWVNKFLVSSFLNS